MQMSSNTNLLAQRRGVKRRLEPHLVRDDWLRLHLLHADWLVEQGALVQGEAGGAGRAALVR